MKYIHNNLWLKKNISCLKENDTKRKTKMKRKNQNTNNNKKTKKQKEQDDEEESIHTLYEYTNFDKLQHASYLRLKPETERKINKMVKKMIDTKTMGHASLIPYKTSDFVKGRVYGRDSVVDLTGWIRKHVCGSMYHDLDFVNCGPTLFMNVCETELGQRPPVLYGYNKNRERYLETLTKQYDLPRNIVKKLFIIVLNGGKYNSPKRRKKYKFETIQVLSDLEDEVQGVVNQLKTHEHYIQMYQDILNNPDKTNKDGTFLAHIWQERERRCLDMFVDFMSKHKYQVGALMFDGLFVRRMVQGYTLNFPTDVLREAEKYIFAKTNMAIKLCEKSMKPTLEEDKLWLGEMVPFRICNEFQRCVYIVSRAGQVRGAKRMGTYLMVPHATIPGVYVQDVKGIDFINRVLLNHCFARKCSRNKLMDEFFNTMDNPRFQLLTPDKLSRDVISFKDGFFNIQTLLFHKWEDCVEEPPITDHYYDQCFRVGGDTPLWDNLIRTQLVEQDMVDMFETMVGRLFYDVNLYDNWQVTLFLKGDANTGKSTVCNLVMKMFPRHQIGTIGKEKTFGLQALHDKRLVICPDMPKNMADYVSQTDFQSMSTGESVSIAQKNKVAITGQPWKPPFFLAGNSYPDYEDAAGSISRRLAVFMWVMFIEKKDTTLEKNIIQNELIDVMMRCIAKYRMKCDECVGQSFDTIIPEKLRDDMRSTRAATNPFSEFILNGSDRVQIVYDELSSTTKEELQKEYARFIYQKYRGLSKRLPEDNHVIKSMGIMLEVKNVCKICNKIASSKTCGLHYNNGKNRTKKHIFKYMKLIKDERVLEEERSGQNRNNNNTSRF